jgi:formylmethanofuran dehydrogenase subunit E
VTRIGAAAGKAVVTPRGLEAIAETAVAPYVDALARLHAVLCPRQVLGVRSALLAGRLLDVPFPQTDKRVVALSEIDGCYSDGLLVVSGCSVGHRTLRVIDLGKVAVTFFDTRTHDAWRIWPRPGVRELAAEHPAAGSSRWLAQRDGYCRMPDSALLAVERVTLLESTAADLLDTYERRIVCARCGEDVFNARYTEIDRVVVCRACTGQGYLR